MGPDRSPCHDEPSAPVGTEPEILYSWESAADPPKVTVIVSLYKYGKYIDECLDSVWSQTLEHMDLIVADDCSPDDSAEAARDWFARRGDRFDRALLLRNRVNRGLAETRNLMFGRIRTDYVFVLDADNAIFPRCLDSMATALDHCDADFAYALFEQFGAANRLMGLRPWDPTVLRGGNYIDAMAMLRWQTWSKLGGYSTDMPVMGWEDYELWLKVAASGGWGVLVPEILARYRVHPSSMQHTQTWLRESRLWDYLEEKYPGMRRPSVNPEVWKRDSDDVRVGCDRARLDFGTARDGRVTVGGWALATSGIERVEVFVDDRPVGQARYGDYRPDLGWRLERNPDGIRCGFSFEEFLPGVEPGGHTLKVRAVSRTGRTHETHRALVVS